MVTIIKYLLTYTQNYTMILSHPDYMHRHKNIKSWDSSVGIANYYRLDDWGLNPNRN
jgi:hypothetical protein